MPMDISFAERKNQYILQIEEEYKPEEKSWWQNQPSSYRPTADYAANYKEPVTTGEAVLFKKRKKEWIAMAVMFAVAVWLIYLLGKNSFSATNVILLSLLLMVVIPWLMKSDLVLRVSAEGIYLYRPGENIFWKNVVAMYIKNIEEEHPVYFFIVHYYDEKENVFRKAEVNLDGLASPELLSATVEAFKRV